MEAQSIRWKDYLGRSLRDRQYLLLLVAVTIIYIIGAKLGLSFATVTAQVTTLWPPSGIALVVLLLLGRKYWPAILVGSFIANLTTHETGLVALGIAVGDTLEAVVAVSILRRFDFRRTFSVPRDGIVFALAAVAGAVAAAIIGPLCLIAGGIISWSRFSDVALTWWQGDLMGLLVFAPALLVYLDHRAYRILKGRYTEFGLLVAITFAASIAIFASRANGPVSLPFLLFPLLVWAAIRFTQVGVVSCTMLVVVVALWGTVNGLGPFVSMGGIAEELFEVQVYACVLMATSMIMATAITERLAAEKALMDQAKELGRLDMELKEANKRVTNILEGILHNDSHQRRRDNGK